MTRLPHRLHRRATLAALLLLPLAPGCALFDRPVEVDHPRVHLDSGVEYEDVIVGLGPAATPDDEVTFDYTAWLSDGTLLDSTLDRGVPVTILIAEAPLPGWREGLVGMQTGGSRKLWLPPEAAYGEAGVPGLVPPATSLAFLIELLAITGEQAAEAAPPIE